MERRLPPPWFGGIVEEPAHKHLGKYLLKSKLGHGGMGVVYLATDARLKRDVALKILPRQMSADKDAVSRFFREARVVARLNHPHVVIIHDVDEERGYCYLVMELLLGGTMQEVVQRGPLAWREATGVIAQACRGLAAAHEAGLIHRDIKPSNIMKAASGVVKLTDFGLAKVVDEATSTGSTKSGMIMGTPQYMSPEQCRGEPLDGRSDLYALGATYFALLVGKPPFADMAPLQLMFAHCSKVPSDPSRIRNDIPAVCGEIVLRAMAKNRADRFASAREMLTALDDLLGIMAAVGPSRTPLGNGDQPAAPPSLPREVVAEGGGSAGNSGQTTTLKQMGGPRPVAAQAPAGATRVLRRRFGRRGLAIAGGASLLVLLTILLASSRPVSKADARKDPPRENPGPQARADLPISVTWRADLSSVTAPVRGAAFTTDGKSLYAGALDGGVQKWDLVQGTMVRRLAGTKQGILAVTANEHWLAAGGQGKCVWLWKFDSDQPHAVLADEGGSVSALAFSPDGERLAVGTYSEVKLYAVTTRGAKLLKVLGTSSAAPFCYMVMNVAFSPDSRWLAATTWTNRQVLVWNAATGALHAASPDLGDNPMAVAFIPGRDSLAIGLQRKGIVLWKAGQGQVEPRRASSEVHVRAMALTPDGQTAIVIGEWGGNIRLVDLNADAPVRLVPRATSGSAVALALSADGKVLASGGGDEGKPRGHLHLFDVTRGKVE